MTATQIYDLIIIGGGVNGAGIARDAAGRGLKVLLVEQHDLASATSSHSSKLVHGGLRYLETYQFRLVREALQEREVLLRLAPHIIWPLRFVLPMGAKSRPQWLIRLGLWFYDHIGGRTTLPASDALTLSQSREGQPLRPSFAKGFRYYDCWVDDARLVVLNAVDAAARGATILTRTKAEAAWTEGGIWQVRLAPSDHSTTQTVQGRVLLNAAGPWVGDILKLVRPEAAAPVRLIKGSHLVVPRLYEGDWAYICQNDDGRIVFFLPYERDFTLIGTTDVPFTGDASALSISDEETAYLLQVAADFFKHPPAKLSIVHSYAGVRSLFDNGKQSAKDITRDYVLDLQLAPAPLLSVYGGKITTYRRLAEHALDKLASIFPALSKPWTSTVPLPGGSLSTSYDDFVIAMEKAHPWLDRALLQRWCRLYGNRLELLLNGATSMADLGPELAPGLPRAEVDYLVTHEFARTAEDILWRRTKLGLRQTASDSAQLKDYLAKKA